MRSLWLKKKEDRRLRNGHLWVFSNEVDIEKSPLKELEPGETVTVMSASGAPLGSACVSPNALLCARLHSRRANTPLDASLLTERLTQALNLRRSLFKAPYYRLCHGEGDLLPGLIIDRYDTHFTIQITTQAIEQRKSLLTEILTHELPAYDSNVVVKTLFFDNTVPIRALENLSAIPEMVGTPPEELKIPENGAVFTVPCTKGQKTGWFYDQRDNRRMAARFANHGDVLDVFCYAGGFGVLSAQQGASSVTFVDASHEACAYAEKNLRHNAPNTTAETYVGDALHILPKLAESGRRFDCVSIDPPAFIKRKKDAQQGILAYRRLNQMAVDLLKPFGILISSSCSYHLQKETLLDCILRAAYKRNLSPQILFEGRQSIDHPELLGLPETNYLKCYIVRLLPHNGQ